MAEKPRREVATPQRPDADDLSAEVRRSLESVVSLQAEIPEDAFTAPVLGVKRAGSGVAIDNDGLVLTIGYLITEAETIWLTTPTAAWFRPIRWRSTRNPVSGSRRRSTNSDCRRRRSGDPGTRKSAIRW